MNRKEKSQLNRELRDMPVPPPPPGLLDSIRKEIPLDLPAVAARQKAEEERLVRFYDRPAMWWMAASIAMIFTFVFVGVRIYLESQVEQQASLVAEPFAAEKAVQQKLRDAVSSDAGEKAEPAVSRAPQPEPPVAVAQTSRRQLAPLPAVERQASDFSLPISEEQQSIAIGVAAAEPPMFSPEAAIAEAVTVTGSRSEVVADTGIAASRSAAPAAPPAPAAVTPPPPPPAPHAGRRAPLTRGEASAERTAAAVAFEADIASPMNVAILVVDHPLHPDRRLISLVTATDGKLTVSSESSAAGPMRVIHATQQPVHDGSGSLSFHPGRRGASILLEMELRDDGAALRPFLAIQSGGARQLLRDDQARSVWSELPAEQRLAFLEELVRERRSPEETARLRNDLITLRSSLPGDHPLQGRIGLALAQLER